MGDVARLVEQRRAVFQDAVRRLAARSRSAEVVRLLVLPGAVALVLGFVFMFLGWYGAAHTARQIEQIPYLISGGFVGLGLVVLGGLLVASALWTSALHRFADQAESRAGELVGEAEDRLRHDLGLGPGPHPRRRGTARSLGS